MMFEMLTKHRNIYRLLKCYQYTLGYLIILLVCGTATGESNAEHKSFDIAVGERVTIGDASRTYLVGFAQDTLSNDWRLQQVQDMARGLARYSNIRFIYSNAHGQSAKQVLDIGDMLAKRVDVLVTSPRDSRVLMPVISRAYRQGIPVVLLSRHIESDEYTIYIAPDNKNLGRQAAQYFANNITGPGHILILKGVPNASTTIERTQAFYDEIANHPNLKVVAEKTANYLRNDAIRAVAEVLAEGIHFNAIYAQSDSMATGARIALRRVGIDPGNLTIVGIDYIQEAQAAIKSGLQDASFTYPTGGQLGAEYIIKLLRGESVPKEVVIPSYMVTIDNVLNIEPIF